jgi:hypothetical protein
MIVGFEMDEKTWTKMVDTRTSDGRAMIMPYVVGVSAIRSASVGERSVKPCRTGGQSNG